MDYTSALAELLSLNGFRRFAMSRTGVGHLMLVGELHGRPIDIVVETGAAKTLVELGYCRSEGIPVTDTGFHATPAAGAQDGAASNVFTLGDARFSLDGLPVRSDGLYAIDMTYTNQKLAMRGAEPIRAVIGKDVLRHHHAVIDYAALSLFLKQEVF